MAKERYTQQGMTTRLRGVGAKYLPAQSSKTAHVYWSGSLGQYVMARRKGDAFELSFHKDCPCSSMIGDD